MTPPPTQPDDEISLLDIVVVLAENFWLLLLAPLAIGAITLGILSLLPKTYESTAILQPPIAPEEANADFRDSDAAFLATRSAAAMVTMLGSSDLQVRARQIMPPGVSSAAIVRSDRQTGLVTVTVQAPAASEAQAFAHALLQAYNDDVLSRSVATMQDIILQAPTLEEKPVYPKRLQLTALAAILSGMALIVFVFIRAAFRVAAHYPESAEKITRIRRGIFRS